MKRFLFLTAATAAFISSTPAHAATCSIYNADTGSIFRYPCKKAKVTKIGGNCSPCVNGCKDDVCQDVPFEPGELPFAAQQAELAGDTCTVAEADGVESGTCSRGYAWDCMDSTCTDSTGLSWWADVPSMLVDAISIAGDYMLEVDDVCVELEGQATAISLCGSDLAWCVDGDRCGYSETRWGCQYFGDWGTLATCVVTVTNEACGGCLEGGDEGEE